MSPSTERAAWEHSGRSACRRDRSDFSIAPSHWVCFMNSSIVTSFYKLAVAGEKAGFSLEDMIRLLSAGLTVENLLNLISEGSLQWNP